MRRVPSRWAPLAVMAAALWIAPGVRADDPAPDGDQIAQIRAELARLKEDYAARVAALEARLDALAGPAAAPPASPPPVAQAAPPPAPEPAPPPVAVAAGYNPAASAKVFNPDISVIGDFLGAAGTNDSPFAPPSLEMHEAEAGFQAVVDPYARADFFITVGHDEVGLEEGFITFTSLPANLLLKVGKMRASFGKVNQMHNHVLPWADRPLMSADLLGGEDGISDAGLSLSRLFPNRVLFLEAIAEVYRGENNVFTAPERKDLTYVGRLRGYRDLSESTNLDFGASFAHGQARAATILPADGPAPGSEPIPVPPTFIAAHDLWGGDLTLRWRPLRRAIYQRFNLRAEAAWSRFGEPYAGQKAFGTYVAAEYQFARRWVAGARFDHAERALQPELSDEGVSALLSYWPSEFSQIRGQYRHTRYGEGTRADEFLFQFLFSIGAHGAHAF